MTAAPTLLDVGGRTYKVGPLRYLELGVIQRHLNEVCRSPLAIAQAEGQEGPELADARKLSRGWKPPQVGADQGWIDALFGTPDSTWFFLDVVFSKHQALADDDLAHILAHVGPRLLPTLFDIAMDVEPSPIPARGPAAEGPKAVAVPPTT